MAKTDKGSSKLPPERLIEKIGKEISYISYNRKGERLVFGERDLRYYFRATSPQWIEPRSTLPVSPNQRAEEAFLIFRKEGFSKKLKALYRWTSGNVAFDFEIKGKSPQMKKRNRQSSVPKATIKSQSKKPLPQGNSQLLSNLQPTSCGSCFCILSDRFFLTNFHVVKGAEMVVVESDRFLSVACVEKYCEYYDLALLRTKRRSKITPQVLSDTPPEIADYVFTAGYPDPNVQGRNVKFTDGSISALTGMRDNPNQQQISVPLQPGNSGGPLVDEKGHVVGVVQATLNPLYTLLNDERIPQGVNYSVSHAALKAFLRDCRHLQDKNRSKETLIAASRKELVKAVIESTCKVDAYSTPKIATSPNPPAPSSQPKTNLDDSLPPLQIWKRIKRFISSR